jgi:hypothetical protein
MDLNPLKVTAGGLTSKEQISLYEMIEDEDKASTYIMSIDLHTLAKEGADNIAQKKFPSYLYNDSVFDDYINVDKIGDWSKDYTYSEEVVKDKHLSKIDATTSLVRSQIEDNISYNIEMLAQSIDIESDK